MNAELTVERCPLLWQKRPVRYLLQSESRVARSVRDVLGWASARPAGRHQRRTMHVITVWRLAAPLCTSTSVRVRIGGQGWEDS